MCKKSKDQLIQDLVFDHDAKAITHRGRIAVIVLDKRLEKKIADTLDNRN